MIKVISVLADWQINNAKMYRLANTIKVLFYLLFVSQIAKSHPDNLVSIIFSILSKSIIRNVYIRLLWE